MLLQKTELKTKTDAKDHHSVAVWVRFGFKLDSLEKKWSCLGGKPWRCSNISIYSWELLRKNSVSGSHMFECMPWWDGTEYQKCPLIFFILCGYIDNLYMSPTFLSIFSKFSKILYPKFFPVYCGQRRVFDTFNLLAEIRQKDNLILGDFRCSIWWRKPCIGYVTHKSWRIWISW